MPIDWVALSQVIPYAGIGILAGVFVLKVLEIFKSWMDGRDVTWVAQLALQRETFTAAMTSQLATFTLALKEQREAHETNQAERDVSFREAMTEISVEMKRLADMTAGILAAQTTHDAHSRETWEKLATYLSQIANGQGEAKPPSVR